MRLLALETTTSAGSVAVCEGGRPLFEIELRPDQRSAKSLAPAIHALLQKVGWAPRDVQLVAVAVGPGSFTGLRVGVTTAKTFAYVVGAEVIGINSLDAIASRAAPVFQSTDSRRLWAVMDAYREQVFAAEYDRELGTGDWGPDTGDWGLEVEKVKSGVGVAGSIVGSAAPEARTVVVDDYVWLARLQPGDVVTGPGLKRLSARLPSSVTALPENLWPPTAAVVAQLALRRFAAGGRDNVWSLSPAYYRPSAAEEKLALRPERE